MAAEDMDACAEGDVMAVLDLRADDSLRDAGLAREVVNRVQKLRKKAGLQVRGLRSTPRCLPAAACLCHESGRFGRAGFPGYGRRMEAWRGGT